jgi:hypothetical protein
MLHLNIKAINHQKKIKNKVPPGWDYLGSREGGYHCPSLLLLHMHPGQRQSLNNLVIMLIYIILLINTFRVWKKIHGLLMLKSSLHTSNHAYIFQLAIFSSAERSRT